MRDTTLLTTALLLPCATTLATYLLRLDAIPLPRCRSRRLVRGLSTDCDYTTWDIPSRRTLAYDHHSRPSRPAEQPAIILPVTAVIHTRGPDL
jgi:hypothetical protein